MSWKPVKTATVYQREYNWTRSPDVWGAMIKAWATGAGMGLVMGIILTVNNSEELKKSVDKATTPTTCLTPSSAPKAEKL